MARPEALLRLFESLLAGRTALRNALTHELENLRGFRTYGAGDSADGAFDSGSEEISTQLAELAARELNQIERALTRLLQGMYSSCEGCQQKISVARLKAVPCSLTPGQDTIDRTVAE